MDNNNWVEETERKLGIFDKTVIEEIKRFSQAVSNIKKDYYMYEIKSNLLKDSNGKRSAVKKHLERVIAYELYHQWSNLFNSELPYIINAEVEKNIANFCQIKEKRFTKYPDMVLHKGQGEDEQIIVCEIKNDIGKKILEDIKKLSAFTNARGGITPYKCGILLITNNDFEKVTNFFKKNKNFYEKEKQNNDLGKILVIISCIKEDKATLSPPYFLEELF